MFINVTSVKLLQGDGTSTSHALYDLWNISVLWSFHKTSNWIYANSWILTDWILQ